MSVLVQCPSCGKSFNVGNDSLGSRAKCSGCGHTFTLSVSMDETGKSNAADQGSLHRSAANRPKQGKSTAGKGKGRIDAEQTPKKLGQYVIEGKLGAGAMGIVYLGHDPILERQVAIKVLPASLSRDEERLKRFLREAKSAARLHHTNVAAVHQAGAEGRLAYIAMEYVEGKSLDKAVSEQNPLGWREATRVIRDAAAGLAAAHAIDLVHRDIKPANLIRTTDGVTKVVDFGLARGQQTNTQLTQQGTLLGTPAYMAPEQWGGGVVDGRTDLYALTCTYYYLLTGRVPFDAPSLPALGYQHRYEPFPDPRKYAKDVPDGICRILTRGSAKDPADRFQNAEDLVSELEVLLVCPDESLTFGSSWEQIAGPVGGELPPLDDPLADPLASVDLAAVTGPAPAKPDVKDAVSSSRRTMPDVPLWVWLATGAALVLLLALGVLISFSTKYGTVQIELAETEEAIQVSLDGETIQIAGLDEPLKLKVGEHTLTASSPSYETETRSFQVKRNETTVVEVTFTPKAQAEMATQAVTPPTVKLPAVYQVSIDPPEAILAISGEGANVTGQGADRTVRIAEPDGQSKILLVATLDGYQDYRQEVQPVAGHSRILNIRLEQTATSSEMSPTSDDSDPTSTTDADVASNDDYPTTDLASTERATVDEVSTSATPDLPAGCVVAYSFDRDTIFSQGSQQYVRDLSGNDYHGLLNNVTIADGHVGTAAQFSESDKSHVRLPDENGQYPVDDFTIAAWVLDRGERSATILNLNSAIDSTGGPNGGIVFGHMTNNSTSGSLLFLYFRVPGHEVNYEAGALSQRDVVLRERWTHVAVTREKATITYFINGEIDRRHSTPEGQVMYAYPNYDDNLVHIGISKNAGPDEWPYGGMIDDFALFDRALSVQELADIYGRHASVTSKERYAVLADGVVEDKTTGLIWAPADSGENMTWDEAQTYCEDYSAGGYDDWRLPMMDELKSLIDPSMEAQSTGVQVTPAIKMSGYVYWSCEMAERDGNDIPRWMNLQAGIDGTHYSRIPHSVLPVRSDKPVQTQEPERSHWAFVINQGVRGITTTPLEATLQTYGVPLSDTQYEAVEAKDGVCLSQGSYQVFRLPNRGVKQISWTGYADGNEQVLINYWNGSQMVCADIRDAGRLATHAVAIGRRPSGEYLHVMVNCTRGRVFTDAITADGG